MNNKPILLGGISENKWGYQYHTGDRVYSSKGVAVAITANGGGIGANSSLYIVEVKNEGDMQLIHGM